MLANQLLVAVFSSLFIILRYTASRGIAFVGWLAKPFPSLRYRLHDRLVKPSLLSAKTSARATAERDYPRLSLQPSLIRDEYDVVIIGSGYGGGVAASRMARAGQRVCVLERGDEKWPGEYPRTLLDALLQYRISFRLFGRPFSIGVKGALFQTVKGEGQDCFLGCGLGGTSLINGSVFLRPDDRVLQGLEWPEAIRHGTEALAKAYARAEAMLQPMPFPSEQQTPVKLAALEKHAHTIGLGDAFYRPPLTTYFHSGVNRAGVQMTNNAGSGNECTGLNDGSKSSVLVTYLADAWARGAEMFCGVQVKYVKPGKKSEGHVVCYQVLSGPLQGSLKYVKARKLLVFGAGSLGTTEILLRSRQYGLSTSPLLGQRLSGNGDMLAFAYNCSQDLNSIAREEPSTTCGPTITGCIDLRGSQYCPSVKDGFIVQDGTVPEALTPVIQALLESYTTGVVTNSRNFVYSLAARGKSWLLGPYTKGGSVRRSMALLVMSHDDNQGTLTLKSDSAEIKWSGISFGGFDKKIQQTLLAIADSLGGVLLKAPNMTVHPLGGAVMSNDGSGLGGVVDHRGRLFIGISTDVYDNICCMDGSIIPASLGVNPCATIAALAEQSCEIIAQEQKWVIDDTPNGAIDPRGDPPFRAARKASQKSKSPSRSKLKPEGVRFSETMQGHVYIGDDVSDFLAAEDLGRATSSEGQLAVTIDARLTKHGSYLGVPTGTFTCNTLHASPLQIVGGQVKLFVIDKERSHASNLVYELRLLASNGQIYNLHGYKRLSGVVTLSISRTWTAATTLYTTIEDANGSIVGRGVLHIPLRNLLITIAGMRGRSNTSILRGMAMHLRYLAFFAKSTASWTFSPFQPLQYSTSPGTDMPSFLKPTSRATTLITADGNRVPLKIWDPAAHVEWKRTPVVLLPGAAVDDRIFSLPTVRTNTVDYFTTLGYRCYAATLRFGSGEAARRGDTAYDARLDVAAVMKYVRQLENDSEVYVIAHCLGSIAMGTALLTGDVEARWIKGMTVSQVFTDLVLSKDNELKARAGLLKVYETLAGSWFPCNSSTTAPWIQRLLDQILRFYPVGSRSEICNSVVCHRLDVPFGRCWSHANLNHATHANLGHFFDGVHTNFVGHLSKMGVTNPQHLRTNLPAFQDLTTTKNMQRMQGIKICFLSGGDNAVWSPQSTKRSYDMFRNTFPEGQYERVVIQGYGHLDCWMGKSAFEDVYPRVLRHLRTCEEVQQNESSLVDAAVNRGSQ